MSMFDSMFGAGASNAVFGIQPDHSMNAERDRQMQAAYTKAQQQRWVSHTWVFNGKPCTLQEFADAVWPGEHEDKMLFLLTHSGPEQK